MSAMTLTGAARTAHERRVLLDEARQRITGRDPYAVADTLALLRSVDARTPAKPVTVTGDCAGCGTQVTRPKPAGLDPRIWCGDDCALADADAWSTRTGWAVPMGGAA